MHKGQTLIPLQSQGTPETTPSTPLAIALGTMGIPLDPHQPVAHITEGTAAARTDTVLWLLEPISECRRFDTKACIQAWRTAHFSALPWKGDYQHPLAVLHRMWDFRTRFVNIAKQRAEQPECPAGLAGNPCVVSDIQLLSALRALGIPQFPQVFSKPGRPCDYLWHLEPQSTDGKWTSADLIPLWHDREWRESHREHPLAYMRQFWLNYETAIRHIRETGPMARFRNPSDASRDQKREVLITRHTSPEDKAKWLAALAT